MTEQQLDGAVNLVPASRAGGRVSLLLVVFCLLAIAGVGWNWYYTRGQLDEIRTELAKRLRDIGDEAKEARVLAAQSQEGLREVQGRSGALEAKLQESQSQQLALESLYQELARSRDDWVLAEIEQTLTIAAQQLQLAGNVQAALLALQTAESRLARPDRPQFLLLRKVLARDIERLRQAPEVDVPGMTLRLDQLLQAIDSLPLLVDRRPEALSEPASESSTDIPWWQSALLGAWNEVKQLVRVQRLDVMDQSLLSPEQRYFVRESLKLRLLHARLALLQRDQHSFRTDLQASLNELSRYFDGRDKSVAVAMKTLTELNNAALDVELPSIADSLNAVRAYKQSHERSSRQ